MFSSRTVVGLAAVALAIAATAVSMAGRASGARTSDAAYSSSAPSGGPVAASMIIPPGKIAAVSAEFGSGDVNCPENSLTYGYQLNGGANVPLDTGYGCAAAAGTTIGPFPGPTLLRIWVTDNYPPPYTFYSDGNHALVTRRTAAGLVPPWTVSVMDSYYGFCGTDCPRAPAGPGEGNFNATISIS